MPHAENPPKRDFHNVTSKVTSPRYLNGLGAVAKADSFCKIVDSESATQCLMAHLRTTQEFVLATLD